MSTVILKTTDVCKTYKKQKVLSHVSMTIKEGEIYGFIGRNGAGKTTLIRMITGLTEPTSGSIELFGESSPTGLMRGRKRMAALIETPAFYPQLTAYENMEILRLQKGIPGKACIMEKLNLVGLGDTQKKKVKDFSLGMKQKLGLAMVLLGDPEFIILDEPTNGLDPMGIVEMRELLKKLNQERNLTILISSHLLGELYQLATCYGIINQGQLIRQMTQDELDQTCRRALEIKVDQPEKAVWVIENKLGLTDYQVTHQQLIKLYSFTHDPGHISSALAKEGIVIEKLSVTGDDLETYFVSLVGGGK